jgi:hypothetical protein
VKKAQLKRVGAVETGKQVLLGGLLTWGAGGLAVSKAQL